VKLKDGSDQPSVLVALVWNTLLSLAESHHLDERLTFSDLIHVARYPTFKVHGMRAEWLLDTRLVEDIDTRGVVIIHDTVRAIILLSTAGDGGKFHMVSPYDLKDVPNA
jgi:hypothetical protein